MNEDEPNTYLGVNLMRWKDDMVDHLRDQRRYGDLLQQRLDDACEAMDRLERRNVILQQSLDDSNAMVAKLQAEKMEPQTDAPVKLRLAPVSLTEDLNLERLSVRCVRAALAREPTLKDAAIALGINRTTLDKYIRDYGIKKKPSRYSRPSKRMEMAG